MRVIQFRSETDPPLTEMFQAVLELFNHASRLEQLSQDPGYGTAPFNQSIWHQHAQDQHLWWMNYDEIYSNIGSDGRGIADIFIGTPEAPGPGCRASLCGVVSLQVVDVTDPVAQGYATESTPGI